MEGRGIKVVRVGQLGCIERTLPHTGIEKCSAGMPEVELELCIGLSDSQLLGHLAVLSVLSASPVSGSSPVSGLFSRA